MQSFPKTSFLEGYWQNSFNLKQHLQDFCNLDSQTIQSQLEASQENLAELGRQHFNWENATEFYRDRVGEASPFFLLRNLWTGKMPIPQHTHFFVGWASCPS